MNLPFFAQGFIINSQKRAGRGCKPTIALSLIHIWQTLTLGITSFLSQISLVAAMAAINNMLRQYGALDPVFGQAQYAQIPMAVRCV